MEWRYTSTQHPPTSLVCRNSMNFCTYVYKIKKLIYFKNKFSIKNWNNNNNNNCFSTHNHVCICVCVGFYCIGRLSKCKWKAAKIFSTFSYFHFFHDKYIRIVRVKPTLHRNDFLIFFTSKNHTRCVTLPKV